MRAFGEVPITSAVGGPGGNSVRITEVSTIILLSIVPLVMTLSSVLTIKRKLGEIKLEVERIKIPEFCSDADVDVLSKGWQFSLSVPAALLSLFYAVGLLASWYGMQSPDNSVQQSSKQVLYTIAGVYLFNL